MEKVERRLPNVERQADGPLSSSQKTALDVRPIQVTRQTVTLLIDEGEWRDELEIYIWSYKGELAGKFKGIVPDPGFRCGQRDAIYSYTHGSPM
ncbi:hypothetical protein GRW49_22755 [Escherichia coli]|nr:hypothetical protein [Escherichia coli]